MLRVGTLLVGFLLIALATSAQQYPVEMSVTAIETGQPAISVENNYNQPMTAFLVTVDLTTNHAKLTHLFFDTYAHDYGRSKAIPAGSSMTMALPHLVGQPLPTAVLRAAIFNDGTSSGDQPWVTELLEMRKILWIRTGEGSSVLRSIAHLSREKSVRSLRWEREFRKDAVSAAPVEKRLIHDWVFYTAIANLDENSRSYNEPSARSAIVEHLTKYFDDWRASLATSKPSIEAWMPEGPNALDQEAQMSSAAPAPHKRGIVSASYRPSRLLPSGLPACQVTTETDDDSTWVSGGGVCGNKTWTLKAVFSGQTFNNGGIQQAFGACYGGYTDCEGAQFGQGHEDGDVTIFNANGGQGTIGFGWNVDSWITPTPGECNCTDPYPAGEARTLPADHPFPAGPFFISCQ